MLAGREKVLLLGCGTCVTVCMAGGEKEVGILASTLRLANRKGRPDRAASMRRPSSASATGSSSTPCGTRWRKPTRCSPWPAGWACSSAARCFPTSAVLPALDTKFYGATVEQGVWAERCSGCGTCVIADFGGVCPVTRCSKSLLNGPCGGSQNGKCEVDPQSIDCGWQLIYDRMKSTGPAGEAGGRDSRSRTGARDGTAGPGKIVKEDALP